MAARGNKSSWSGCLQLSFAPTERSALLHSWIHPAVTRPGAVRAPETFPAGTKAIISGHSEGVLLSLGTIVYRM